jgi:putative transposase
MSTCDIERSLRELYGVNVSRDLISRVTDAVMDDARVWQQRPLDDVYRSSSGRDGAQDQGGRQRQRRACYLALGVRINGERDVLGMWSQDTEGAKFWMRVQGELKHRGVRDVLICCVDGLTGFPEAIEAIFPDTVGANVHRSPHQAVNALRPLPRVRPGRQGPAADLHRDRGAQPPAPQSD